ncbi:MAG: hypothetical protein KIS71_12250, partial [Bacteroidetes bacterium]|nr:hypothetical protein [Bacteroidota bacterium]
MPRNFFIPKLLQLSNRFCNLVTLQKPNTIKKLLPAPYVAAALLLWSTVAHSQTINLSVTPPVVPA